MKHLWVMITTAIVAAVPAMGALAQTEPYSEGTVPATTLVTPTVLGTTITREELPKTGSDAGWLVAVAFVALLVGITLIWVTRHSRSDG